MAPHRVTSDQHILIGLENVPGVQAATLYELLVLGVDLGSATTRNAQRQNARRFARRTMKAGKSSTRSAVNGGATFDELGFMLCALYGPPVTTQLGVTAAYQHVWKPPIAGLIAPIPWSLICGDSNTYDTSLYNEFTDLALDFAEGGLTASGTLAGRKLSTTGSAVPAAGGGEVDAEPLEYDEADVFLATTSAGLAAGQMDGATHFAFNAGGINIPHNTLDSRKASFQDLVNAANPTHQIRLQVEANSEGRVLMSRLEDGAVAYCRGKVTGPLIASTYYYSCQVDAAISPVSVTPLTDVTGVYAEEYTNDIVWDSAWNSGQGVQITLVNKRTAYTPT